MNLTQRQLRMFTLVASTLSISRASEALHLSQPALSRAIREFELQLGVTLFQRTTRSLVLTAEGRRFLPVAQRLLSDMNHAVKTVLDEDQALGGIVSIAAGTAIACSVLPEVLRKFSREHPSVRINLRDDNSRGIVERVMRSDVDFGIGSVVGESNSLELLPLLSAPIGLLFNPDCYKLPRRAGLAQLTKLPLLKETDDTSIMNLLRLHGSSIVASMESGIEVSSLAVQLAMARAGVGVAVMSALGASHPSAAGLRFTPLSPAIKRDVFLIHRRDRPLRAAACAMADEIIRALRHERLHPLVRVNKS